MRELEDEITRLNLRAEQLLIHLQQIPLNSAEAIETRRTLQVMVETIVFLKGERAHLVNELKFAHKRPERERAD
jgi:hypothetical protein